MRLALLALGLLGALAHVALSAGKVSAQEPPTAQTPAAVETAKVPVAGTAAAVPEEKTRPVRISRLEKPPVIDGRLDEAVWKSAAVFKDFYQISPGDNAAPSLPTEVLIGYDAKYLYFAFHCFDEPGKVRATIPKRDNIFADDTVRVFLDTFNDKRRAYVLAFNPLGVQQDCIRTEGVGPDCSIDIVMESKGTLTPDGYVVEVAIPFKSLRYEAGKGKLWGLQIFRRIHRFDEEDSWMPISRDVSGLINQAGHITGLEDISTERTLELIPSALVSQTGARARTLSPADLQILPEPFDPGRFVNRRPHVDLGLTANFGLTPTATLSLAVNPDFAQVEADQTVITANQRFPIFFEEKRPFFLEGVDVFHTPVTVIHTRAIIDPDAAVKLTGKQGRTSFGLLLASDNGPGNFSEEERADPELLPVISKSLDRNAIVGALRLKRDIGAENSLGLVATTYNFVERHNDVFGIDGRFKLDEQTTLDFQMLGTTSRRRFFDADLGRGSYRTGNALGYSVRYEKAGRNFGYNFDGSGFSRYYLADVGFTRRTDTNREELTAYYQSTPRPGAKLVRWRFAGSALTDFDWQGRQQGWAVEPQLELNFRRQIRLVAGVVNGYERLFEEEFGAKRTPERSGAFAGDDAERSGNFRSFYGILEATPSEKYSAFLYVTSSGGVFDLDFGADPRFPRVSPAALLDPEAPLDPGPGDSLEVEAEVVYQPTEAWRTSLNYKKSRLIRHDNRRTAFDENIFALRSTYQFTRFLFARARVDYSTLNANVRGQFLLGWTPNPGTAFYAGYNDDVNRNGFNPFTGQLEPGFRRNGRVFFVKLSYLIRRSF
ncbi:MAG: carbohydrate binding family 9 domain-containing protein [Pyrinomonadaceae bacterium]